MERVFTPLDCLLPAGTVPIPSPAGTPPPERGAEPLPCRRLPPHGRGAAASPPPAPAGLKANLSLCELSGAAFATQSRPCNQGICIGAVL